eukprot:TRINITY_DN3645_c0_g1_i1.p2 TRINITY_DN3645_c0_g1~~TRINITY_DN3645_c0_g1_i1.p2  ORF type:complete len:436 (+),score=100.40 TRINITY_DN3645_c0_g1_i1:126-1310(+)
MSYPQRRPFESVPHSVVNRHSSASGPSFGNRGPHGAGAQKPAEIPKPYSYSRPPSVPSSGIGAGDSSALAPSTAVPAPISSFVHSAPATRSRSVSFGCDQGQVDPLYAAQYASAIMDNLRLDERHRPKLDYLHADGTQARINNTEKMRYILVDWMIEVHVKFRLVPETLFLTVELLDRFLQIRPVVKTELQLAAVTSMLIACKYEEVFPPPVGDFNYISARVYSNEQILAYELVMLADVAFNITFPTSYQFLTRMKNAVAADGTDISHRLSTQNATALKEAIALVAEGALLSYGLLRYSPSIIAAAAMYLARKYVMPSMSVSQVWSPALEHYSGYSWKDFELAAAMLNEVMERLPHMKSKGLYRKYDRPEKEHVSVLATREAARYVEQPSSMFA